MSFFDTTITQSRKILGRSTGLHKSVRNWLENLHGHLTLKRLWKKTWLPYRSVQENCFLWQLIYRIPAKQRWRSQGQEVEAEDLKCTRCQSYSIEDVIRCIWHCSESSAVGVGPRPSATRAGNVSLNLTYANVIRSTSGGGIEKPEFLKMLWALIASICWYTVMESPMSHYMKGKKSSASTILARVRSRLRTYWSW
jgi:ribosomal protein L37AE/L43A